MQSSHKDLAAVEELSAAYKHLLEEIGKVIIGQESVIRELVISLLARGHCLLVGVPGLRWRTGNAATRQRERGSKKEARSSRESSESSGS